ncbi:cytochrome P450 307a1-like [Eupeodes corollae]|uniref:cytochrome P450 307a1-like n=1 Tax=Eupeodes corollae TaxID=290404 RepID=UPI00249002FC|nr:cytochrome P450 307a1-like [Eupeodes corollae]
MEVAVFDILILIIVIISFGAYLKVIYECFRKARVTTTQFGKVQGQGQQGHTIQRTTGETVTREYKQAPGPIPWPVLGNLAMLGKYKVPFEAFTAIAKEYGDAYTLTLGTTRCFVVNNLELIREVLNQNGKFFGGRPDFLRYHKLFGGDRNNSLALCDWSQLQQKRRNLARRHCSPRDASSYFSKMNDVGCIEMQEFMDMLDKRIVPGQEIEIKQFIQQTCANMFSQYMCSVRFDYDDVEFQKIVWWFDEIFWEINQGYAVDFLPWLAPLYKKHLQKIINWSTGIRKFILERVINDREQNIDLDEPERDFTDALLKSLAEDKNVSRDTIIFMLEDFLGGHSAVGNLVMLAIAYVVRNPEVGVKIQEEVDRITEGGKRFVNFMDMEIMPYTMGTIYETLRYSSSPIVPHVATEDSVVSGYGVTAGTVVFINNYELNTSPKYWDEPEKFNPERFVETVPPPSSIATKRKCSESSDSGVDSEKESTRTTTKITDIEIKSTEIPQQQTRLKKNIPHFLPFSIGKRTCIGQNLVRGFGFILLANILQRYNLHSNDLSQIQTVPACVALPCKGFPLVFTPRENAPKI